MPDIKVHTTEQLRKEIARRDAEKAEQSGRILNLQTALRAATESFERIPNERMHDDQLERAERLVYELVYRCLPGGSGQADRRYNRRATPASACGMDHGWITQGIRDQADSHAIIETMMATMKRGRLERNGL